jgi:hypothetical protein
MDAFAYLSVLISIVIGLAITQILQGYRAVLIARPKFRIFIPTILWGGLLLLINVQAWWAMFGMQYHDRWTFLQFTVVLLQAVLLYMLAALVFPDAGPSDSRDLRVHYFAQARWFFAFGVALLVVSVLKDIVVSGHLPSAVNLGFHGAFVAVWLIAAVVRSDTYHRVLPWFMLLAFSLYILLLFSRL